MSHSIRHDYKPSPKRSAHGRSSVREKTAASWMPIVGIAAGIAILTIISFGQSSSQATAKFSNLRQNIPLTLPNVSAPREHIQPALETPAVVSDQLELTIQKGDTLGQLFDKHQLSYNDLHTMLQQKDIRHFLTQVRPGQTINIDHQQGKIVSLNFLANDTQRLNISRNANHELVSELTEVKTDRIRRHAYGTVTDSLFLAGKESGLSDRTVMNLAGVFAWDIDFILDIRKGDSFSVIYEELWREGEYLRDGEIVAAEFINQGEPFQAVRYTDPNDKTSYYTPEGRSVRKAFLRAPLPFSPRVTSNFNMRRVHPVFKTVRPHRGVDYGASTGTRILAAGDGKVIFRGVKRGYGNVVILQHGGNVTTLYAHMSRFNNKVKYGSRVNQGQTIGYVGKTGYATGPHLHFEYQVNGVHKNPRTVKLPEAKPVPSSHREHFKQAITPILAELNTLSNTPTRLAQN